MCVCVTPGCVVAIKVEPHRPHGLTWPDPDWHILYVHWLMFWILSANWRFGWLGENLALCIENVRFGFVENGCPITQINLEMTEERKPGFLFTETPVIRPQRIMMYQARPAVSNATLVLFRYFGNCLVFSYFPSYTVPPFKACWYQIASRQLS